MADDDVSSTVTIEGMVDGILGGGVHRPTANGQLAEIGNFLGKWPDGRFLYFFLLVLYKGV